MSVSLGAVAGRPGPSKGFPSLYAPAVAIDPRVDIGHVHLKVADLDRALAFWRDVLGFEEQARMGDQDAFISAGGYHHHIGLNTWESQGGSVPPPGTTGLYHVAVRFPDRKSLAETVHRVMRADIPLEGASDHGASAASTFVTRIGKSKGRSCGTLCGRARSTYGGSSSSWRSGSKRARRGSSSSQVTSRSGGPDLACAASHRATRMRSDDGEDLEPVEETSAPPTRTGADPRRRNLQRVTPRTATGG